MIQLRVIDYRDRFPAIETLSRAEGYRKIWKRGNVSFLIAGPKPVGASMFDNPDISVVCRADLPAAGSREPAAHIADLYSRYGDGFASSLRGTFAIVVYDHRIRCLKAWSDHFGGQRLVYTESPHLVGVSTDLRLLLDQLPQPPDVYPAAVQEYLQYTCIPAPRTIYKGFQTLEPGHQLICNPRPVARRFWDMAFDTQHGSKRSEADWADETLGAVRSAVTLHTQGVDDPNALGCFLSGGTDSSSIAAITGHVTGRRPKTFSIGFDHPRYNEMHYARIAASRCNAEHHEYFVTSRDVLTLLRDAGDIYDEPFGNSSIIPTFFCARLAAEHGVTHLLAGDGGDELFGGNSRYCEDRVFQRYRWIPSWLRRSAIEPSVEFAAKRTSHWFPSRAASYIKRANIDMPDRSYSYSLLSSVPATDLFTPGFLDAVGGESPLSRAREIYTAAPGNTELNRWLYLDLKITIGANDLRKVTTMASLAGITVRYPLLDPSLAEFTGTIPSNLKVKGSQLRYLFKKAMADVLPSEILTKKKHGFGLPYSVWVGEDNALRDFTFDILGSKQCRERGYFRQDVLEWLWAQYQQVNQTYYGDIMWVFMMLELWHLSREARKPILEPMLQPSTGIMELNAEAQL